MALHKQVGEDASDAELEINPIYSREQTDIPRYRLPEQSMLPRTALQVVRDELILDGNARLNLATFVTTWMEPEADMLMAECSPKNMIDKDEYPQTAELERRCVNILGSLWNAQCAPGESVGCSTTGRALGVPQAAEDVHAAPFEFGGLRVLVLVDHVLGGTLGHQHVGLWLHPRGDERGQVQPGVAVEDQLIPHDLQRRTGQHALLRQPVPRDVGLLAGVDGIDLEFGVRGVLADLLVQCHSTSL